MRNRLIILFVVILVTMLWVSVRAALDEPIRAALVRLWPDLWFQATLCDTYCGFLTVYAWVAYKEPHWIGRVGWLVAILLLGNISFAIYMLHRLIWLAERTPEELLLRKASRDER